MPKAIGIYLIQNTLTHEFYIGQSALRFLEYPVHLSSDLNDAIRNNCVYLNYKWVKND